MELILQRLEQQAEILRRLDTLVTDHEKWINRRENEIDAAEDRFRMLEAGLDNHQRWMDKMDISRVPLLKEFEHMKREVHEHSQLLRDQKVAKRSRMDQIKEWGQILGLTVLLLKVFKVLP